VKILYISTDPGIDLTGQSGNAIHIRAFVRAMADLGHQVTLVCSAAKPAQSIEADLHATVRLVPLARWNRVLARFLQIGNRFFGRPVREHPDLVRVLHNLRFARRAAAAARELAPDFIYERYSLWGLAGLWLARKLATPLVLEVNAPLVYEQQRYRAGLAYAPLAHWVEHCIWRKAGLLIAVSDSLRSWLQKAGVNSEFIHILPNAVDPRLFHLDFDGKEVRERFHLDGRFVIGFVGTFKPWHGADLLLAAFQDLHQADPSTHLLLVGDGPLRLRFEEEVRETGLHEAVTFAGGVAHQDVPHYLAAMDVAIAPYPALEEFYFSPIKLFEYMAAGRAVVASRAGQVAEIVVDGVTGLLFEPGDRAGLVSCVARFQKDAALRNELGRRASAACSEHTWSQNAARVIHWVQPLLDPNGSLSFPGEEKRLAQRFQGNADLRSKGESRP
jgi:glycosyltransferase involved in cell wall biosynthesis